MNFFFAAIPRYQAAEVSISEKAWEHLQTGGKPHPTTFVQRSQEIQTAKVMQNRAADFVVSAGLENLVIMKTAGSAFEGYIQDSLTTLPPAKDRLFGTALRAHWNYARPDVAFASLRTKIRETLLAQFAAHQSKSVQHTLYAMGKAVLEHVAEVEEIELAMPNLHCLLVDLSRFGQDNPQRNLCAG